MSSASSNIANWLSTASSLAATLIGIVTLLTVYIAAVQLASQNRIYRLGLSWRSLGPWESKVGKLGLLGLQRRVYAPSVSLNSLVEQKWEPTISFPIGFPKNPTNNSNFGRSVEEGDNVQAKATWVNFMQAVGLSPGQDKLFEMQDASELVNGIVPMPWTGKDLVGMCSILGFQSYETTPSFKSPMPLPMQWSGPLGWMQFRSSPNGCVAEFRRRKWTHNQISPEMHAYWYWRDLPRGFDFLRSRLWNSINGFCLPDNGTLYLGGTDRHKRPQEEEQATAEADKSDAKLLEDLTSDELSDEQIMLKIFGKKKSPQALTREPAQAAKQGEPDMTDFLESMLGDKSGGSKKTSETKEVLSPCPGLLSVTVQGELAYNRGLRIYGCQEYYRKYTDTVDLKAFPYNLGNLCMDLDLLKLMKDAFLMLRPDGFYFSPTPALYSDIKEVYKHIEEQSNKLKQIFEFPPKSELQRKETDYLKRNESTYSEQKGTNNYPWQRKKVQASEKTVRSADTDYAMMLCNHLQRTRKTARAVFSVEDMCLLAKASASLKGVISPNEGDNGMDLVWAMLSCPKLSSDIRESLKESDLRKFMDATATCKDSILDCSRLLGEAAELDEKGGKYDIPHVGDGEFTGNQILAALSDVFIRYYWIEKAWLTDVAGYDATMPQTVTMC